MNDFRYIVATENSQNSRILTNIIKKLYPGAIIAQFDDGLDAWQSIEKYDMPTIFISSYNTKGINSFQVIKKIFDTKKNDKIYTIFISEKKDKEYNIKIINQGFDDFIQFPFSLDELVSKLKSANRIINEYININFEQTNLGKLRKELYEFRDRTYETIKTLIKTRFPDLEKITNKYKESSTYIAQVLFEDLNSIEDIRLAAELCLLNKMFLNDTTLRSSLIKDGHPVSPLVINAQSNASKLISGVWGSDNIAMIITHIYENFDGTGFPLGCKGWQIPIGSRILRVLLDYDDIITFKKLPHIKAFDEIDLNKNVFYDPKVVCLFDQYLGSVSPKEKKIEASDLLEGMLISRNVYTETFNKIIGAGTTLTPEKLERLNSIISSDPILGHIYIGI